jgi:hypothetical protein
MVHKLEIKEWDSGDWAEIWLDNKLLHSGHSIPGFIWIDVLRLLRNRDYTIVESVVEGESENE